MVGSRTGALPNLKHLHEYPVSSVTCGEIASKPQRCTQALPVRCVKYDFTIPGPPNSSMMKMNDKAPSAGVS